MPKRATVRASGPPKASPFGKAFFEGQTLVEGDGAVCMTRRDEKDVDTYFERTRACVHIQYSVTSGMAYTVISKVLEAPKKITERTPESDQARENHGRAVI